jgi:hypothetical protein
MMATKKGSGYATEMRRCTGSARFGIEPHEAPVSTFPKQPSRPDGLGTMCAEHWKAYVKGLREARATKPTTKREQRAAERTATKDTRPAAKATTKRERRRSPMVHKPPADAAEVAKAEALVAAVDALPADQMVERVGQDDVQAALEVIGNNGNGRGHAPGPVEPESPETPLGEALDGGTDEADAA